MLTAAVDSGACDWLAVSHVMLEVDPVIGWLVVT